ncbi:MAG: hypothetical protein OHK0017_10990 [Patescibacteria group bacterium]
MSFVLILYFSGNSQFLAEKFKLSITSLLQNELASSIWITGNKDQLNAAINYVESDSFISKRLQPSWVLEKSDLNGDRINAALDTIKTERLPGSLPAKLIFLRIGDYLHPNFFTEASKALNNLNLNQDPASKFFLMGTSLHTSGKTQSYTAEQTLKIRQDKANFWSMITNPKYLSLSIPFFWDIDLILKYNIRFNLELKDFNLQFAKFNLDNLLLASKLNSYIYPQPVFNPSIIYISKEALIEDQYLSVEEIPSWKSILFTKSEDLQNISGLNWAWRSIQIRLIQL